MRERPTKLPRTWGRSTSSGSAASACPASPRCCCPWATGAGLGRARRTTAPALRSRGATIHIGRRPRTSRARGRGHLLGHQAGQPRARRGARARPARRAAGRDAGRAHAAQVQRRHRRAPTARRRPRPWWRRCSTRGARPHGGERRIIHRYGLQRPDRAGASGWWWRPTSPTAPSTACPRPSPS
jgi:hypothetical protein